MFFVFFFKQKTAYEMRISDWSSDVCSSDLAGARRREHRRRLAHGQAAGCRPGGEATLEIVGAQALPAQRGGDTLAYLLAMGAVDDDDRVSEIGRASWRERVCQYV